MKIHFILYVSDQNLSTKFYTMVLNMEPSLNVPGMTEFTLNDNTVLGLMPITGIKRLLGEKLPDPCQSIGIPRSELYLIVDDPLSCHHRALMAGAVELSALELRDWGHNASYCLDPDGHVIAFAHNQNLDR